MRKFRVEILSAAGEIAGQTFVIADSMEEARAKAHNVIDVGAGERVLIFDLERLFSA